MSNFSHGAKPANMLLWMVFSSALWRRALRRATRRARREMSEAKTWVSGASFFRVIAMQPEPVQRSRIRVPSFRVGKIAFIRTSVSGRGIRTWRLTKKGSLKNQAAPTR